MKRLVRIAALSAFAVALFLGSARNASADSSVWWTPVERCLGGSVQRYISAAVAPGTPSTDLVDAWHWVESPSGWDQLELVYVSNISLESWTVSPDYPQDKWLVQLGTSPQSFYGGPTGDGNLPTAIFYPGTYSWPPITCK